MSIKLAGTKTALKSALLFREQKNRMAQTLIFFVTSRCNARCDFCLYKDQVDNPVAKERELTIPEISQIAKNYGKLHYLALSGGEPFVRRDIEDLCQTFIDNCETSVIDIPSNFYYTKSMIDSLGPLVKNNPNVIFDLQMSIDQTGEAHDTSRKVKNLYSIAVNTFQELSLIRRKHNNLKLKVNIVYLDRNRDDIQQIVNDLSDSIVFDRVQLTFPHDIISTGQHDNKSMQNELTEFTKTANSLTTKGSQALDPHTLGMLSVKRIYHRLLKEAVNNKKSVGSYCEAGRNILVIDETGEVFPCEPLMTSVGNLRDHNYQIAEVLQGDAYSNFRASYLGDRKCNCTWSCAIHSNISVNAKYLPELTFNAAKTLMGRTLGR